MTACIKKNKDLIKKMPSSLMKDQLEAAEIRYDIKTREQKKNKITELM